MSTQKPVGGAEDKKGREQARVGGGVRGARGQLSPWPPLYISAKLSEESEALKLSLAFQVVLKFYSSRRRIGHFKNNVLG